MPYLMRAEPYDASLGAVRPIYRSDTGFTSEPGDSPANTYFVRRIDTPLTVKRSLYNSTAIGGYSETSFGAVISGYPALTEKRDGEGDQVNGVLHDGSQATVNLIVHYGTITIGPA